MPLKSVVTISNYLKVVDNKADEGNNLTNIEFTISKGFNIFKFNY